MAKFQMYKDARGEYRWRLKGSNGEVVASSEGYTAKQSCKDSIAWVQGNAPGAPTEDDT